jgi:alkylhydroperoxidase family enzyme
VTDEQLAGLERGDFAAFEARERAALQFAEELTRDSNHIGDELFRQLRHHFDEGELVELACMAGLFNYFNRFNNALQMEPTK